MNQLPVVRGLPLIGNLFTYRTNKINFLSQLRDQYGDQVTFLLGKHELILLTNPEDIHWLEMKNAKNYVKATNLRELVGDGILMSEGEKWRKQRRLIQPTFHQGTIVKMVDGMNARIATYLDRLESAVKNGDAAHEMNAGIKKMVFEIMGDAVFGSELGGEFDGLRESLGFINTFLTGRFHQLIPVPLNFPLPSHLRFHAAKAKIDQTVFAIIDQKQKEIDEGKDNHDLLTKIMQARDPESGEKMPRDQLRDEVVSMLLAGFETTGNVLPWAMYLLCKNQESQRALQNEIDEVLKSNTPNGEDTFQLPYLTNVIDETLRLYPAVWAWTKRSLDVDTLRGTPVKKGAIFFVSPYLIHRNPKLWNKPDDFDPARWTTELKEKNKLAYFPFGMGPRTCVGKHFALMEIKLILIQLLQRFDLSLDPASSVEPDFQITLGMKEPLKLRLKRRAG